LCAPKCKTMKMAAPLKRAALCSSSRLCQDALYTAANDSDG